MKDNKFLVVSLAAVLSLSLTGCTKQASSVSSDNNSNGSVVIKQIKGEELAKIQKDDKEKEKYLVIDVRENSVYKEGHLKHAINIAVKDIDKSIEQISKWRNKEVIVYGATDEMTKEGANALVKQGFKNVASADNVEKYKYELVKYNNLIGAKFQDAIWDAKGQFIDIRTKDEFDKGHVFNAKNVDPEKVEQLATSLPEDKEKELYFYSKDGDASAKAAQKAYELGYKNVFNAIDGTEEFNYKYDIPDCCLPGNSDTKDANGEESCNCGEHEGHDMMNHDHAGHMGHNMMNHNHVGHMGHNMINHNHAGHMGHNMMNHNHAGHMGHNMMNHNHANHDMNNHANHDMNNHANHDMNNHANHDMNNHANHDMNNHANHDMNNHANHDMNNHANHDMNNQANHDMNNHANHDMNNHANHDMNNHENHDMNNHANHDMNNHANHDMNNHANHDMNNQANHDMNNHANHDMNNHANHDMNNHANHDMNNHANHDMNNYANHDMNNHANHDMNNNKVNNV